MMEKEGGGEKMGRDEGRERGRKRKEGIQWQFLGQREDFSKHIRRRWRVSRSLTWSL